MCASSSFFIHIRQPVRCVDKVHSPDGDIITCGIDSNETTLEGRISLSDLVSQFLVHASFYLFSNLIFVFHTFIGLTSPPQVRLTNGLTHSPRDIPCSRGTPSSPLHRTASVAHKVYKSKTPQSRSRSETATAQYDPSLSSHSHECQDQTPSVPTLITTTNLKPNTHRRLQQASSQKRQTQRNKQAKVHPRQRFPATPNMCTFTPCRAPSCTCARPTTGTLHLCVRATRLGEVCEEKEAGKEVVGTGVCRVCEKAKKGGKGGRRGGKGTKVLVRR